MQEYFELDFARAQAKDPEKYWDDPAWIAEEKLNGWRFMLHFAKDFERPYFTGRRISSKTGLQSEKGLCVKPLWPLPSRLNYTVLDGEIMPPPGVGFREMASFMNVDPDKAADFIDKMGLPRFYAFDCLWADGVDLRMKPMYDRRLYMEQMVDFTRNPLIQFIPIFKDKNKREAYDTITNLDGEGVVLKEISAPYGEGWIKVKKFTLHDVVVTGFTNARYGRGGKFLGQIGAVRVSAYASDGTLIEIGKVSGMTDDVRLDISLNKEKWLGQVIEVAATGWGKTRLFHPRFKRHRPDANPMDATLKKILEEMKVIKSDEEKQRSFNF